MWRFVINLLQGRVHIYHSEVCQINGKYVRENIYVDIQVWSSSCICFATGFYANIDSSFKPINIELELLMHAILTFK